MHELTVGILSIEFDAKSQERHRTSIGSSDHNPAKSHHTRSLTQSATMKFLSTAFLTFNLLPSITIALEAAEVVFDPTLFTLDAASDGAKTHYGDPSEGCMKDEHAFQIQGVAGMICAPKCTAFRPCPSDVPKGVTAVPQCALKSSDGNTYCALLCQPSEDEDEWPVAKLLRKSVGDWAGIESAGGQCGDASCQAIGGAGICTYSN